MFEISFLDTVQRATIENSLAADILVCHLLSKSEYIFIGTDGGDEIALDRKFQEFETGGVFNGTVWSYPLALIENLQHETAESILANILSKFEKLQQLQRKCNLPETKIYDIKVLSFDNTAVNTGSKNGFAALLNKKREEFWKADGKPMELFSKLIYKVRDDDSKDTNCRGAPIIK